MDHPYRWLKFLNAGDLTHDSVDFDGLDVESPEGDHLGEVKGFIVDADSGRPYYVVVDSGGWFRSRHFLLPVGHARLRSDDKSEALVADISRDRIDRFPGFDKTAFEKLSADDLKLFNDATCAACSLTVVSYAAMEPYSATWERPDYTRPDWWQAEPSLSDHMPESSVTGPMRNSSPDVRGRAQPGNVLGIETGGERTSLGDTADDETTRLENAEKSATRDQ
jgi:hypothetical protein